MTSEIRLCSYGKLITGWPYQTSHGKKVDCLFGSLLNQQKNSCSGWVLSSYVKGLIFSSLAHDPCWCCTFTSVMWCSLRVISPKGIWLQGIFQASLSGHLPLHLYIYIYSQRAVALRHLQLGSLEFLNWKIVGLVFFPSLCFKQQNVFCRVVWMLCKRPK